MSEISGLMRAGDVRLNGARQIKDVAVRSGDKLEIYVTDALASFTPKPSVMYEDENFIIFNKQAGMSCLSDKNDGKPTVYSMAVEYMQSTGEYCIESLNVPYLCHRLDHNTGGLVIVAKNQTYYEYMLEAISERRVKKFYNCVVVGTPRKEHSSEQAYLIKDAHASKVKIVPTSNLKSLPIMTKYTVLQRGRELSLLEVELVTGRTHQIRAHLSYLGFPLLGDDKYGNRKMNKKHAVKYQVLWATKIIFHVGINNALEYLNGTIIEADEVAFPDVSFDGDVLNREDAKKVSAVQPKERKNDFVRGATVPEDLNDNRSDNDSPTLWNTRGAVRNERAHNEFVSEEQTNFVQSIDDENLAGDTDEAAAQTEQNEKQEFETDDLSTPEVSVGAEDYVKVEENVPAVQTSEQRGSNRSKNKKQKSRRSSRQQPTPHPESDNTHSPGARRQRYKPKYKSEGPSPYKVEAIFPSDDTGDEFINTFDDAFAGTFRGDKPTEENLTAADERLDTPDIWQGVVDDYQPPYDDFDGEYDRDSDMSD